MKKFRYLAKEKLSNLPKAPGVYALASQKTILYIGKAANIRERVKNHFPASPDSRRASRGGHKSSYRDNLFVDQIDRIGWIETLSDIDALLLESQLIKQKKPRYNVMWRDDKKYFYVAITKEKLPRVFLTHQPHGLANKFQIPASPAGRPSTKSQTNTKYPPAGDLPKGDKILHTRYIGPFVDGKAIKQVLRLLRRAFPYYTQKKHSRLPCPWCHLNLCPGPNPDQKEYKKNIQNLRNVLKGKRISVLKTLQKDMVRASKLQEFEKATLLRDQLFALERIVAHHTVVLAKPWQNYHDTQKQFQKLLNTKNPIVRVEAYDISNIQGKFATGSMVTFLKGKPAKEWYRKFKIHISGKPNDFAMMQEVISRRIRHPEWPYPDLMIIDGGKPQLTAALQALRKSEIRSTRFAKASARRAKSEIYVAALAKKHNELFLPAKERPLLLKNLPQEVSNLLLHIRDEAHRFAISYHRKLRRVDLFSQN